MLVTFKTDAYANITMFGDVAVALLELMGHSGTVPGALMPQDIPDALALLTARVAATGDTPLDPHGEGPVAGEDEDSHVSLARRALPLIELLKAAQARQSSVIWES